MSPGSARHPHGLCVHSGVSALAGLNLAAPLTLARQSIRG
ncbi:DNA metabolism protein [Rahnella variigena]|nr:DNA metabolism protein [Rahnella aquatilis]RYJ16227.1 DNA metabolism protein [Rahnella variigena]